MFAISTLFPKKAGHTTRIAISKLPRRHLFTISPTPIPNTLDQVDFVSGDTPQLRDVVKRGLRIYKEFITQDEHDSLVKESDAIFSKRKYVEDHWDNVISNYKETEKNNWVSRYCVYFNFGY